MELLTKEIVESMDGETLANTYKEAINKVVVKRSENPQISKDDPLIQNLEILRERVFEYLDIKMAILSQEVKEMKEDTENRLREIIERESISKRSPESIQQIMDNPPESIEQLLDDLLHGGAIIV